MPQELESRMAWQLPLDLAPRLRQYAVDVATMNGASPDLADDIAQVTLLRLNDAAARNPGVIDLVRSPTWKSYVATATRNVLAGYHRSEARRARREAAD